MLLVFDLDDTLIPTSDELTPKRLEVIIDTSIARGWLPDNKELLMNELLYLHDKGESTQEVLAQFFKGKESNKAYQYALEEIDRGSLAGITVSAKEDVHAFLKECASFCMIALVTKGTEKLQREKMQLYGIKESFFEKVYIVADEEKKGAYYQRLKIDCKKDFSDMMVVGDKIVHDLYDAKNLGCKTVHIRCGRGRNQTRFLDLPDYVIENLKELRSILYDK